MKDRRLNILYVRLKGKVGPPNTGLSVFRTAEICDRYMPILLENRLVLVTDHQALCDKDGLYRITVREKEIASALGGPRNSRVDIEGNLPDSKHQ
ncbi:hypothetical protein EVAR_56804_1 [Eumeta japonica]|uniref:Uncharacterized protein n=1 Tax=Eumeta variegata TaxID=151549 RepID=A0A4C1Y162_EUMVA|nr:hypothetical protein EVAR_56804_1 [Eumeta japonica]